MAGFGLSSSAVQIVGAMIRRPLRYNILRLRKHKRSRRTVAWLVMGGRRWRLTCDECFERGGWTCARASLQSRYGEQFADDYYFHDAITKYPAIASVNEPVSPLPGDFLLSSRPLNSTWIICGEQELWMTDGATGCVRLLLLRFWLLYYSSHRHIAVTESP